MNIKRTINGILFSSLILSGCATTSEPPMAIQKPVIIERQIDMAKVNMAIEEANHHLENGDPEKAQGCYQILIDTYPDIPIRYQCGLLTNAALASLQMGDGRRFTDYARQLEAIAINVRPLPRNTQIVLAMMQVTGNRATNSELWISQPVERAVRSALTAK